MAEHESRTKHLNRSRSVWRITVVCLVSFSCAHIHSWCHLTCPWEHVRRFVLVLCKRATRVQTAKIPRSITCLTKVTSNTSPWETVKTREHAHQVCVGCVSFLETDQRVKSKHTPTGLCKPDKIFMSGFTCQTNHFKLSPTICHFSPMTALGFRLGTASLIKSG